MAQKKKQNKKIQSDETKLDFMKEVMVNQRKNEKEKQRQIYCAMKEIQVERKG